MTIQYKKVVDVVAYPPEHVVNRRVNNRVSERLLKVLRLRYATLVPGVWVMRLDLTDYFARAGRLG